MISSQFVQFVGRLFRNFFENQHIDYILIKYSYYSNCTALKITTRISLYYTSKIFLVRNVCVTIITCFLYHYYYYYYLTHRIHNVFFPTFHGYFLIRMHLDMCVTHRVISQFESGKYDRTCVFFIIIIYQYHCSSLDQYVARSRD